MYYMLLNKNLCSKTISILIFIQILNSFQLFAQDSVVENIYLNNYHYRFNKHQSEIDENNIHHQMAILNSYWWKMVTGDDTDKLVSEYKKSIEKCFELMSKNPKEFEEDNDKLFYTINSYAYLSRLELFKGKTLNSAMYLNKSIKYLKKSFGKEEENENFKLSSGLYHYFMAKAMISNKMLYKTYFSFYPKGDIKKGLNYLKELSQSENIILKTEALYFLMKIFFDSEEDYKKALFFANKLSNLYPDNILYIFYQFRCYLYLNNHQDALDCYSKIKTLSKNNNILSERQKIHFINLCEIDLKQHEIN
jgi:tetratricopeptide (TPR) repeat protein